MSTIQGCTWAPPTPGGVNQDLMRRQNLASVLATLGRRGETSRTDLALETGLTRAGVASLLKELRTFGLIDERGVGSGERVGRPAAHARLTSQRHTILSLSITRDGLSLVRLDLERHPRSREFASVTTTAPRAVLATGRAMLQETLTDEAAHGRHVLGVAVIVPAIMSADRRRVISSPTLGWRDVDVVAGLDLDCDTVIVDNYANLAALAESLSAPGEHLVHVQAGEGIGAGTVVDGVVQRGGRGFAGAVGHIPMDACGPVCTCGRRGCLEVFANTEALLQRSAPQVIGRPRAERLADLVALASADDPRALAGITETARWLGRGIGALINMVSPDVVTVGGYVPTLATWVMDPLIDAARSQVVVPDLGGCRIQASTPDIRRSEEGAAMSVQQEALSAEGLRAFREVAAPA